MGRGIKKEPVNMKNFTALVVYIIGFVAVWNICDFLFCTFITQSEYEFSISTDMLTPLVLMIIIQTVSMKRKK